MLQPYVESDTKLSDKKKYLKILVTDILQNNGCNCCYSVHPWLYNFSIPSHFYHEQNSILGISNDFKSEGERRRAFQLGASFEQSMKTLKMRSSSL